MGDDAPKTTGEEYSILTWLASSGVMSEQGDLLTWEDRAFWLDILADWNRNIVIKGAAQVGKSVVFTLKTLFALKYLRLSIIYTFPSDDDVKEFVASKVNKIIEQNRHVFGRMDSESIERKEIDGRFVYFKGTISKTAPIATTADVVIHDEASRSNQQAMEVMRSRVKASKYGAKWMFSNPTVERDILDLAWRESDQKEWNVVCPVCSLEQEIKWPDSVDIPNRRYKCLQCGGTLSDETRRHGRWKANRPESTTSGYHVSHLICPWIPASAVIEDSERDPEYFWNFVLGEPYSPSDLRVDRSLILDCWTPRKLLTGKWFLGVDVGSLKHYALGSEQGVVKFGRFSEWNELDDIIRSYNPFGVIDAMPENEASRSFVKNNPRFSMCYLGRDKESNRVVRVGDGDERGVIHADRNRLMDLVISNMQNGLIPMNVPTDQWFRMFIKHCESLRRVKTKDRLGVERSVWESTNGEDHLFFALCFYELARMGNDATGEFVVSKKERPNPIERTPDGGWRANLDEFLLYDE
jgi:hypothetical protein